MIGINELKKGMTFIYNNKLYSVVEISHLKMGRGKAIYKCKIHDVLKGSTIPVTFSSNEKFEKAFVDTQDYQYLFKQNDNFCFMNTNTYDEIEVSQSKLEKNYNYLVEGEIYKIQTHKNIFISIILPDKVRLKVVDTEENVNSGNSETAPKKPATLESGLIVQVPLFIKNNEYILVSTLTGKYISKY